MKRKGKGEVWLGSLSELLGEQPQERKGEEEETDRKEKKVEEIKKQKRELDKFIKEWVDEGVEGKVGGEIKEINEEIEDFLRRKIEKGEVMTRSDIGRLTSFIEERESLEEELKELRKRRKEREEK